MGTSVPLAGEKPRVLRVLRSGRWITALFVIALFGFWQLYAKEGSPPPWIVAPSDVARALGDNASRLLADSGASAYRVVLGYLIGVSLGVVVGLMAGVSRIAEDLVDPIVGLTYSIPKIALYPAILLLMGYSDKSRVLLISLVVFYPTYINAHAGTRGIDRLLLWIASNAGASRWRTFWGVVFRAALPRIIVGMRISIAVAFVVGFIAEAVGGPGRGLGQSIVFFLQGVEYREMYAAMACYALLGIIGDQLLGLLGRRLTRGLDLTVGGRR